MAGQLALGTVQFGMPYGVANSVGQVPPREAAAILARAREAGVDTLQTAVAYGDSEKILGEIGVLDWKVVSKLPAQPRGVNPEKWARTLTESSLSKLRIERLDSLMLHRSADLLELDGSTLYDTLLAMKEEGKIGRVGVSIYSPAELAPVLPRFPLDLVQAPYNVIDRRLHASGWLERLVSAGVEVHVRSAFLQGLLLMHGRDRPDYFARWNSLLSAWDEWLVTSGATAVEACLGFLKDVPGISRIVVGVDSVSQLDQVLAPATRQRVEPPAALASDDEPLVNPELWPGR